MNRAAFYGIFIFLSNIKLDHFIDLKQNLQQKTNKPALKVISIIKFN
jgi:hypothetical protein